MPVSYSESRARTGRKPWRSTHGHPGNSVKPATGWWTPYRGTEAEAQADFHARMAGVRVNTRRPTRSRPDLLFVDGTPYRDVPPLSNAKPRERAPSRTHERDFNLACADQITAIQLRRGPNAIGEIKPFASLALQAAGELAVYRAQRPELPADTDYMVLGGDPTPEDRATIARMGLDVEVVPWKPADA